MDEFNQAILLNMNLESLVSCGAQGETKCCDFSFCLLLECGDENGFSVIHHKYCQRRIIKVTGRFLKVDGFERRGPVTLK